jgi:hypothetical protein
MFSAIKSKFFSTPEVHTFVEEDIESLDGDEFSDEEMCDPIHVTSDYILGDPIYEGYVLQGILHRKFITKASKFIPNVTDWAYNRNIDLTHVKGIQDDVLQMAHPHLIGSFKIVKTIDDSQPPKLLDGHHRKMALEGIMRDNEQFDMDVDVDVYYVTDVDNCDREVRDLFVKANNNRNVDPEDIPDILVMLVIEKMIQRWSKNIKQVDGKKANRPNITKTCLVQHLKPILNNATFSTNDADRIFQKIVDINNRIRLMSLKDLFGTNSPAKRKLGSLQKASESGFFLNLDCKHSIEVWTRGLLADISR